MAEGGERGRTRQLIRVSGRASVCLLALLLGDVAGHAQLVPQDAQSINDRIRALEREAADLARQSKTLLSELRALEIERRLRTDRAARADAAVREARGALQQTNDRIAALEKQRAEQTPRIKAQLVDLYKHGRGSYAKMLFDANGLRDLARATRAVTAMASLNERRLQAHRATLETLSRERAALEQTARQLQIADGEARRARALADRAVAAHTARIVEIDTRRDLNAQYVGELQAAYDRLSTAGGDAGAAKPPAVPMASFRGALAWPADGPVRARFGQSEGRLGGTAVRNGMEIAAGEDAPVRAVHAGTVTFADPFTGFGTLVIVDHGSNNYSLYGYLGGLRVQRGETVTAGAELGRVGLSPAGPPALYFELRIDGSSVDPLQWLLPAGGR
jgi:septal ring factor EnvC (AmiA/AmiB activator)